MHLVRVSCHQRYHAVDHGVDDDDALRLEAMSV